MNLILAVVVDTISLLFMGDVMQHAPQLRSAHLPDTDTLLSSSYDYSSYFRHVRRHIQAADFAVANMEFSLAGPPYSGYPRFSAPQALAHEAAAAGIDLFLCANNHICDRGRMGLEASLQNYKEVGIPVTGFYRDSAAEASMNPHMVEIRGIRLAFINFTYGTNGIKVPPPYIVNPMVRSKVQAAIDRAKLHEADFIIALPHWGPEYSTKASESQREWAEFLISRGVDAVIGTHPHVVQEVEFPVVYSLGNFISNMSRRDTRLGLMYRVDIAVTLSGSAHICATEAIPVWCARKGCYEDGYTVLPVAEFIGRKAEFQDTADYIRMTETYYRLKHLFKHDERSTGNYTD